MDQPNYYSKLRSDVIDVLNDVTISAYRVEKETGVSRSTFTRLRSGERYIDRLSLDTCERIASVKFSRSANEDQPTK